MHFQEEPAIAVLADHEESLYDDHFLGHGHHLNDAQIRIPFIVSGFTAVLEEPMGQSELRAMIRAGLSTGADDQTRPTRKTRAGKKVFQYIGNLKRPEQIGWSDLHDRFIVDLRGFHFRYNTVPGPWNPLIGNRHSHEAGSFLVDLATA